MEVEFFFLGVVLILDVVVWIVKEELLDIFFLIFIRGFGEKEDNVLERLFGLSYFIGIGVGRKLFLFGVLRIFLFVFFENLFLLYNFIG